jgi:hypothetical protein
VNQVARKYIAGGHQAAVTGLGVTAPAIRLRGRLADGVRHQRTIHRPRYSSIADDPAFRSLGVASASRWSDVSQPSR